MSSVTLSSVEDEAGPSGGLLGSPGLAGKLRFWLSQSLGFDLRSLALLRIVAPSVYLLELLLHWQWLEAMYTDGGMLPRTALFESIGEGWSVYMAFGSVTEISLLYCCQLAALVCLIVGWRTRWASLVCYIFTVSLQNRFPSLPGWETEIRLLFLLGVFLPWGEWFSLDARARRLEPEAAAPPAFSASAATAAWRLQVCILYLASGLLKGGAGWQDGTAVEVSLASDAYCTPLGLSLLALLKHYPQSMEFLTLAVPLVEIFIPVLLLSPWPRVQMLGVLVVWILHAGFGLCLRIGMFSPICCSCMLGFIPSEFWNRLGTAVRGGQSMSAEVRLKTWESAFLVWVSVSMLLSALEGLPEYKEFVHPPLRGPWKVLGLQQHWGMFVPPPFEGGWHVIKGKTLQGEWVDLLQDRRDVSDERPEWPYKLYPGVRGYLFLASHVRWADPNTKHIQEAVADYYRRRWENWHPAAQDRLSEVEIAFMKRKYVPGKGFDPSESVPVYSHKY